MGKRSKVIMPLMTFKQENDGRYTVTICLNKLYPDDKERKNFKKRFKEFRNAIDPDYRRIFNNLENDILKYDSECLLPKLDFRPPLVLLLGNPAPHSVVKGMFFSYQHQRNGNIAEHRFWRYLRDAGILSFKAPFNDYDGRRQEFLSNQQSKYRIGLSVFYSMPSPPSHKKWGGVHGLEKLLGRVAFREITSQETYRAEKMIKEFCGNNGAVIVFQKDAYLTIKSDKCPDYSIGKARQGKLMDKLKCNNDTRLFCSPPTRYNNTEILKKFIKKF